VVERGLRFNARDALDSSMQFQAIKRAVNKNIDLLAMAMGRYPRFVVDDAASLTRAPVFTFHQEPPEELEGCLRYVAENGYRTLTADDYYDQLERGERAQERCLLLTFDDGPKSLWSVVFPLLRKYNLTAVAFIVPGLIKDEDSAEGWRLADEKLCSWQQIEVMHKSGNVDFQLHSMYHHTVFVSPRIVSYVTPAFRKSSFFDGYFFPVHEHGTKAVFPDAMPLGAPLYESLTRFAAMPRYVHSTELECACAEFVGSRNGAEFFKERNWKQLLDRFVRDNRSLASRNTGYESETDRALAIEQNLSVSKAIIESRLCGKKARHFCFPWHEGSASSARISKAAGYAANFWGWFVPKMKKGSDYPMSVRRLNPAYLWRLPGKGRKPLTEILMRRLLFLGEGRKRFVA